VQAVLSPVLAHTGRIGNANGPVAQATAPHRSGSSPAACGGLKPVLCQRGCTWRIRRRWRRRRRPGTKGAYRVESCAAHPGDAWAAPSQQAVPVGLAPVAPRARARRSRAPAGLQPKRRVRLRRPARHGCALRYPSTIWGIRTIRGSRNTSNSSRLVLENSDTMAPSSPAWNQCHVFGGIVYCSPGPSVISWNTV
jgi:hypothetical protein